MMRIFHWTCQTFSHAVTSEPTVLINSYKQLDDNLTTTPTRLLPSYRHLLATTPSVKSDSSDQSQTPTPLQQQRATIAALTEPADNGSCAITALVDAEAGDLYVASTGDCRAVAGWEKDGVWRCDVLSEDQMGENPHEVER